MSKKMNASASRYVPKAIRGKNVTAPEFVPQSKRCANLLVKYIQSCPPNKGLVWKHNGCHGKRNLGMATNYESCANHRKTFADTCVKTSDAGHTKAIKLMRTYAKYCRLNPVKLPKRPPRKRKRSTSANKRGKDKKRIKVNKKGNGKRATLCKGRCKDGKPCRRRTVRAKCHYHR